MLGLLTASPRPLNHGLILGATFERRLHRDGMHAALELLNATTPYRLTGGVTVRRRLVRSVVLFDRKKPHLTLGVDVPWNDSYCRLTAEDGCRCKIIDAPQDSRLAFGSN